MALCLKSCLRLRNIRYFFVFRYTLSAKLEPTVQKISILHDYLKYFL